MADRTEGNVSFKSGRTQFGQIAPSSLQEIKKALAKRGSAAGANYYIILYVKKVVIIDYQLGNLFSVKQACNYLGYETEISSDPHKLLLADYAILPGVGAFKGCDRQFKPIRAQQGYSGVCVAGQTADGCLPGTTIIVYKQ